MEPALLAQLLAAAIRLTGLPSVEVLSLPNILPMSKEQIAKQICPDKPSSCDTLIALYQPSHNRILYRDTLNLKLTKDQSFIVHELVHVLQFRVQGIQIFSNCRNTMNSERQAFQVQDRFLAEAGEEYRVGGAFRFMRCEDSEDSSATKPASPSR